MDHHDIKRIEKKWRKYWEDTKLYHTDLSDLEKKLYALVMFIYPSGDRLHIGHWYNYGPTDTWARFKKMQGFNVLEPIGYDAFGLPAENFAIKQGTHPAVSTARNIKGIRQQLKSIGTMYDWTREIDTSSPEYYKWTQWLFLQLYKRGLAYRKKAPVNWCPGCKTVLANEQVIEGQCERCDSEIFRKDLKQWFFKITEYADRLLDGHKKIDWPEKTITMQKNWIGRSEGALISFKIADTDQKIDVFTTRPDTLWGVTYMVFAPEHQLISKITSKDRLNDIQEYINKTQKHSEIERTSAILEKTGVFTGCYAINPVNQEKIPIWIADYVLLSYGTGAVMAVPAHDQRDFEFASKYNLEIRVVITPDNETIKDSLDQAFTGSGVMLNSGQFSGIDSKKGITQVINFLEKNGIGKSYVTYKLRDWLISRQRYWGAPIPIIYCEKCGELPVEEAELPIKLPEKVQFSGRGESPLNTAPEFLNTKCHICGSSAKREVDTMDTFVCSSWYYLRFICPKEKNKPWDKKIVDQWLPVDQYVGGAEHAVMHLLYARFVTMALYDMKLIGFEEPFKKLIHQGTITNQGAKMSKSRENVVNPDQFLEKYGSDCFRMYMMFMGSYEDGGDWNDEGITGIDRFLNRIWRMVQVFSKQKPSGTETSKSKELDRVKHHTIKEVTNDLDRFHFNTAISRLMEFYNKISEYRSGVSLEQQNFVLLESSIEALVVLLAPFAPHLAEELWLSLNHKPSIFQVKWPGFDKEMLKQDKITIVVQINGKLRDQLVVTQDISDEEIINIALKTEKIQKYIGEKDIIKKIVVPKKLVNFVIK